jgi:hypothetical protein
MALLQDVPYAYLTYRVVAGVKKYSLYCIVELNNLKRYDSSKWDWRIATSSTEAIITLDITPNGTPSIDTFDEKIISNNALAGITKITIILDDVTTLATHYSRVSVAINDADMEGDGGDGH